MEAPDFAYFMLKKISENPEMAEINSAILSLYEKGMLDVWWDSSSEDFLMKASPFGEQSLNEHFASNFVPAEA
jgi:hypothetical protein